MTSRAARSPLVASAGCLLALASLLASPGCSCNGAGSKGDGGEDPDLAGANPDSSVEVELCPELENEVQAEIGLYPVSAGDSMLPPCPLGEANALMDLPYPGWDVVVEKVVRAGGHDGSKTAFDTVAIIDRLDQDTGCSAKVVWTLSNRYVVVEPGARMRLQAQRLVNNPESDVVSFIVIRDERGVLTTGWASGVRPETWDSRIWPELFIGDMKPFCEKRESPRTLALTVTLDGRNQSSCQISSGGQQTCILDGRPLLVLSPWAYSYGGSPSRPPAAALFVADEMHVVSVSQP